MGCVTYFDGKDNTFFLTPQVFCNKKYNFELIISNIRLL